jgi:hypothetical protein
MSAFEALLQPFKLKGHTFKNRIISTSHVPGYAAGGVPSSRHLAYLEEKARGGIAMTMFGGSSIVSPEVIPIYSQLDVSTDAIIPHFKHFAARIHAHGAKLMCQISHMGRRTSWDDADWIVPIAPSSVRDPAHHAVPRAMEIEDIERIILAYGAAARVAALRGHDVVLFEASAKLGGQVLLAARSGWRRDLIGIVEWLAAEIQTLGVAVRFNLVAELQDVLAESPDVVVFATGGMARQVEVPGAELAVSSWDVLSQEIPSGGRVLIYDEEGAHTAIALADHLSTQGSQVSLVTADRLVGRNTGGSSYPVYLANLARAGAAIVTDMRLVSIAREGNGLKAKFAHAYGDVERSWLVDEVVTELGTAPNNELFHALKPRSCNRGEIDPAALVAGAAQPALQAVADGFVLFAVGDAVASRDIHAAIHDSLRLMKDC